ncbi:uncharacterized protein THITE_2118812 [Thermothielavioides terrestris NRRL 8126]|uniref:Nonsense-mediated mRNA decay factor n=1 Tax=Thermothielavioides terrestris (strain ATCC 38088 / NRRL 8126) TaxID=578455 RepID=G2RAW9_THETT|nr:uncharacterized protein THITE_2118812 [Thermothielavioides terrestris NRRL 8126]AEO68944.1 hypothetical protein THITE_2118812 [Thermothielavioides terrestris NRRL 8126]
METYRLRCMETIWLDIRGAKEKDAENTLWQVHALVTKAYRKVLARLHDNDHVVLRRKIEKLYSAYLKTAQYFYRGYLQRVCARYDMKDLRRIARRAELQEMAVPDEDKVNPAAAQLQDIVIMSCHKTLIYLGDLARYRTLLRPKDRKGDGALAYYFLANELIPESGHGHHQCGVIYVETEDHLNVVYHLYRALACAMPHPNARTNLEREFRELQKRNSAGAKHALAGWFVKLHAFYFQGNEFAERKELEGEVDHRLVLAMKTGTGYGSEGDLLKIILINITAYVAAQDKINAKWTVEGSRSCQFILLLNLRTIHAIARLLGEEIADLIKLRSAETPAATSSAAPEAETATKFTPVFNRVLPLLRVYMAWLCFYGSQLVDFKAHLEPQFGAMCAMLGSTLSLLFDLLGSEPQLGTPVSWRFPEDEMTLGINCLNGPDLHNGCQLHYDAFTRQPKPRIDDIPSADHTADDVMFTRCFDVLLCALDLSAPESRFPFTTSSVKKGTRELTAFVYLEGGKPDPAQTFPGARPLTSTTAPAANEQNSQGPAVAPSPCESNELSEDRKFYGPDLRKAGNGTRQSFGEARPAVAPIQAPLATEYPIEKQLFQILNDFMAPPESAPAAKSETPARSHARTNSYGLGSAAMAEAFAAGATASPAPGSAGTKPIPTLPWNYFYTPAPPVDSALRTPSTSANGAGWGTNGAGLPRPASSGNTAPFGTSSTTRNPLAGPTHRRYDSLGQASLMGDEAEALQSLHLGSNRASQPLHRSSTQGAWPGTAAGELAAAQGIAPASTQQSPWGTSTNVWQAIYGQNQAGTNRAPDAPFSTFDFSANSSSLPQVNSPWGLPTTAQRFSATQSPGASHQLGNYAGAADQSPSVDRYAAAYAATSGAEQAAQGLSSVWPNASQPRTGATQPFTGSNIWANPVRKPAVGETADGKPVVQGMPKR